MTSKRDPEGTRDAILGAALTEFSEKGFGGGRIEIIAKRAGVNKQALYYHYGNKEMLYQATLEHGYELVRTFERSLVTQSDYPPEKMRSLISSFFDTVVAYPEVIALVSEENRLRGRHLNQSSFTRDVNSLFVGELKATYVAGVKLNCFRDGIDPVQLWITIVAIVQFYFSNIYTLSRILDTELAQGAAVETRRRHVLDFVLAAISRSDVALPESRKADPEPA